MKKRQAQWMIFPVGISVFRVSFIHLRDTKGIWPVKNTCASCANYSLLELVEKKTATDQLANAG